MTGRLLKERALEKEERVSSVGTPVFEVVEEDVDDESVGREPLKDASRENFCQRLVSGMDKMEAWYVSFRDDHGRERCKKKDAASLLSRLLKRDEVRERIYWLTNYGDAKSRINKFERTSAMDALWHKWSKKALSDDASYQDVKAFLEISARQDLLDGIKAKPKLEIRFPQLDKLISKAAMKTIEEDLGISTQKTLEDGENNR